MARLRAARRAKTPFSQLDRLGVRAADPARRWGEVVRGGVCFAVGGGVEQVAPGVGEPTVQCCGSMHTIAAADREPTEVTPSSGRLTGTAVSPLVGQACGSGLALGWKMLQLFAKMQT